MEDIQVFCKEGLDALSFLVSRGYTHTDLKPENVLLEFPELYEVRSEGQIKF
jgi:serine/threonine protein kinase